MEEIFSNNEIFSIFNETTQPESKETGILHQQELDLSFETLPQVQASLERNYGLSAGRGLAIRSGRSCFKHLLREYGHEMGLKDLEFRLLSLPNRLLFSGKALDALINHHTDVHTTFKMDDNYMLWTIDYHRVNGTIHNSKSVCHLVFGILQEELSWVSGGKIYRLEETHCIESNDPCCKIRIMNKPIS